VSYDRKLEQVCPHRIVGESLFLNSDRQTIRPLRPIASAVSVSIRFNSEVNVPAFGYATPAIAKGSLPGPFDITSSTNLLVVSVNGGPDQTIAAPVGNAINAKSLCLALTTAAHGLLSFKASSRRQVQVTTATKGPVARLVFKSGSTLAATLGLVLGKVYRGVEIYPPWSLINDPNTLSDRPSRFIVFDRAIESTTDFVEIGYTTVRQECRRCGGVGVENDWQYTSAGGLIKVRNSDLLSQEVLKITYTERGSNQFHPWYGTGLLEAIGKKLTDQGLVQNLILSDLQDAFRRWQSMKKQQEEALGQFVSDEEYPFRLMVVNLEQDPSDPTVIFVNAFVQSRSNEPIQISRGLVLPVPLDIMGSTVQDSLRAANQAPTLGR
jgi:hypothetical protein